ncbi:MAG TPA: M1 family peptidase, partial [Pseudonocardia sp.]
LRIGDECFFALLRAWTTQHRHGSVTTEQFTAFADVHAGADLSPFFSEWLYGEALPDLPR